MVGACIGTDAHTVGIDAILNIKGFAGEKGLEYYREIKVVNCGAQVLVPELVAARPRGEGRRGAGQSRSSPRRTPTSTTPVTMSAAFREAYPAGAACRCWSSAVPGSSRGRPTELGVDRIFGRGTTPARSRHYLVHALATTKEHAR